MTDMCSMAAYLFVGAGFSASSHHLHKKSGHKATKAEHIFALTFWPLFFFVAIICLFTKCKSKDLT